MIGAAEAKQRMFSVLKTLQDVNEEITTQDLASLLEWPHTRAWDYLVRAQFHKLTRSEKRGRDVWWKLTPLGKDIKDVEELHNNIAQAPTYTRSRLTLLRFLYENGAFESETKHKLTAQLTMQCGITVDRSMLRRMEDSALIKITDTKVHITKFGRDMIGQWEQMYGLGDYARQRPAHNLRGGENMADETGRRSLPDDTKTSNERLQWYREGFRDGYEDGLKNQMDKQMLIPLYEKLKEILGE